MLTYRHRLGSKGPPVTNSGTGTMSVSLLGEVARQAVAHDEAASSRDLVRHGRPFRKPRNVEIETIQ